MALLIQLATLVAVSIIAATLSMWIVGARPLRKTHLNTTEGIDRSSEPILVFGDDLLEQASGAAKELVPGVTRQDYCLSDFVGSLEPRFSGLDAALQDLPENRVTSLTADDGLGSLILRWDDGKTKIKLEHREDTSPVIGIDPQNVAAMEEELETLRATAQAAPFLVWRETAAGNITWANNTYLELITKTEGQKDIAVWPPARIFPAIDEKDIEIGGRFDDRVSLKTIGSVAESWFSRRMIRIGSDRLFVAHSIDDAVRAEMALDEFIQTLTKTFAHLTSGLAIFDKDRNLALFNPALGELTGLKPEFLMLRPTLQAFLDKLRDKRMIPEPRDYRSWRQRMYEVETAARDGLFEENWVLPGGQTYKVTGRPHPDGALAFIFEDKSAEISLTRRFRSQIDVGQAVIDGLPEAIAVFSAAGTLTLCNDAYGKLWGTDVENSVTPINIVEATRLWSEECAPTPIWGDIREFACTFGERAEWIGDIRLTDGRGLICRVQPLAGGNTLVAFSEDIAFEQAPRSSTEEEADANMLREQVTA